MKTPEMNNAIKALTGIDANAAVATRKCPFCGKPVDHVPFKDALSRREAAISGVCQTCQDKVFEP